MPNSFIFGVRIKQAVEATLAVDSKGKLSTRWKK
jgi:hypothetical protein